MRKLYFLLLGFALCAANAFAIVPVPQAWNFTSETGAYANIGFVSTGSFLIAGRPIQAGDAIGAFYASGQDTLCAGYMAWDGENFGFAVWGDDEFTSSAKEGFASGEPIVLKAWDGIEGRCLQIDATMQFGNLTFQNNALAIVSGFVTAIPPAGQPLPAKWNYTGNTGTNANIGFQTGGNFQISDRPMQQGDAIGAFYISAGDTLCGGYLRWGAGQNGFVAWGDDEFTTDAKEGFASNETYIFLVWDSLLAKEYKANVTISYGSSSFQPNGMTIISAFAIAAEAQSQTIELQQGWNDISSYIVPNQNAMQSVMSGISGSLLVALDKNQASYSPPNVGNLASWASGEAYHVYMQNAATLTISGSVLNPENYPIQLVAGWNFVPYLSETELPVATALASIIGNVVCVKDNNQFYFPAFGIIDMATMKPGKGYMIYVSQACTLTYPAN